MAPLNDIVLVFLSIISVFYLAMLIKPRLKISICSICVAVSFTWMALLIMRAFDLFNNDLVIALLLGQSVVGGYYMWERRASKNWLIFRLPIILTLTLIAWSILQLSLDPILISIVIAVWLVHSLLYTYSNRPGVKSYVDKLIACCGRW